MPRPPLPIGTYWDINTEPVAAAAHEARTIKLNGRPVLAWDIARFGEDETVGMRREAAGYGCTGRTPRPTR